MKSKAIFVLIAIMGIANLSHASINEEDQVFSFKFKHKGDKFEYTQKEDSYEEAYEKAAQACFRHYKAGRHVSEDTGLDIIDVCANPHS
jgi:hypothetical protein